MILGLDLSLTSTGYALLHDEEVVWHGSVTGGNYRDAERLERFYEWVRRTLRSDVFCEHVAIEGYSYGSHNTNLPAIGELGGVIKLAIYQAGIPMHVIPPSTWKKQLLGRGNLPKDMVRVEAFKRYGVEFASQDTLDAWAVAMCCRRQLLGLDKPEPKSKKRKTPRDLPLLEGAGS